MGAHSRACVLVRILVTPRAPQAINGRWPAWLTRWVSRSPFWRRSRGLCARGRRRAWCMRSAAAAEADRLARGRGHLEPLRRGNAGDPRDLAARLDDRNGAPFEPGHPPRREQVLKALGAAEP